MEAVFGFSLAIWLANVPFLSYFFERFELFEIKIEAVFFGELINDKNAKLYTKSM